MVTAQLMIYILVKTPLCCSLTAAKKATLNSRGADGGDLMAMTEDAMYMNERLDDDYDFM